MRSRPGFFALVPLLLSLACVDPESLLRSEPPGASASLATGGNGFRQAEQMFEQVELTFYQTIGCVVRGSNLVVDRTSGTEPSQGVTVRVNFSDFDQCTNQMVSFGGGYLPLEQFDLPADLGLIRVVSHGVITVTTRGIPASTPVVVNLSIRAQRPLSGPDVLKATPCATAAPDIFVTCYRTTYSRGAEQLGLLATGVRVAGTYSLNGTEYGRLSLNSFEAIRERNVCIVPIGLPDDPDGLACSLFERVDF